ncbi:hypothetical protein BN946_scf184863.g8 [Trametes cinnabarina]|uniref:DUF4211 domain-containing protein n=1 Tax=Pycnoporus cinnabarinus TaxID=5643 RepID=A0A060SFN9_PYCCI|nr:hypothetical protein BN946_scf184863.g8 [Trametes cinnabarina]
MPRKTTASSATPRKSTQKKLDSFFSSSPARSTASAQQSSPIRPARRTKRRRIKEGRPNDERSAGPSKPADGDDGSQSSDAGAIRFEPQVVEVTSSEEEPDVAPRPSLTSKGKKRARRAHSEESLSPEPSGGEAEAVVYVRRGKRAAAKASILDSDPEDDGPRPRKLIKGKRPSEPNEDVADLLQEIDEERIIEPRLRTRDKRSAFQKNLEKLKRKKRGEAVQSGSESSAADEDDVAAQFAGARPGASSDEQSDDDADEDVDEEDNFIVEDDSAAVVELPAEFSMNTYQDLLHHFKIICQLFVHMLVHDPEDRSDVATRLQNSQYFSVALQITRRKLTGMRDSLVAGSTWRPSFRKALDTYPNLEIHHLEFTVLGCAACNLGGRKSTLQGRLSGDPYDKLTYEPIAQEEPSSDDSDEDEESGGLPKQFDLGRFCAKRTRTYHQFTHWEYHLFHALKDEVDGVKAVKEGRSFVRVAYAAGKQPPEDLTDADAIMDWLDERQVINLQWHEIKTMMDSARNLEAKGGRGGDGDSD